MTRLCQRRPLSASRDAAGQHHRCHRSAQQSRGSPARSRSLREDALAHLHREQVVRRCRVARPPWRVAPGRASHPTRVPRGHRRCRGGGCLTRCEGRPSSPVDGRRGGDEAGGGHDERRSEPPAPAEEDGTMEARTVAPLKTTGGTSWRCRHPVSPAGERGLQLGGRATPNVRPKEDGDHGGHGGGVRRLRDNSGCPAGPPARRPGLYAASPRASRDGRPGMSMPMANPGHGDDTTTGGDGRTPSPRLLPPALRARARRTRRQSGLWPSSSVSSRL